MRRGRKHQTVIEQSLIPSAAPFLNGAITLHRAGMCRLGLQQ
jgi:hypothetical protein